MKVINFVSVYAVYIRASVNEVLCVNQQGEIFYKQNTLFAIFLSIFLAQFFENISESRNDKITKN